MAAINGTGMLLWVYIERAPIGGFAHEQQIGTISTRLSVTEAAWIGGGRKLYFNWLRFIVDVRRDADGGNSDDGNDEHYRC